MTSRLLVLRPQPGAAHSVARAQAMGFDAVAYPLFAVQPCAWDAPGGTTDAVAADGVPDATDVDALLFTSANAVRHAGAGLAAYRHLPAFAVGPVTADALRDAGFARVVAGSSGVQEAVGLMTQAGHARALHLSGETIRPYGAPSLTVLRRIVYRTVEQGDAAGLAALAGPGAILLVHSPRAGMRVAQLLPMRLRAGVRLVAISPAALEAAGAGWGVACAADRPDDKAMLALAATLCD